MRDTCRTICRQKFYQQLKTAPVDVLLQDELNHPSLFLLNRRLRREANYPILSIVHHPRCYESHPIVLKWLYRQIERSYLSSVNGFIFNSATTRRAVSQILDRSTLPRSIVAHPAGDRFESTLTPDQIVTRSTQSGPLRVVFVGNLIPRKGLHVLIEALALLPPGTCEIDRRREYEHRSPLHTIDPTANQTVSRNKRPNDRDAAGRRPGRHTGE